MKKILHIANWYPNKWDNIQSKFIKEQYKVFTEVTDTKLINVQVRDGKKWITYEYIKYSEHEEGYYLLTKIKVNKIIELLTTLLLLWVLIKSKYKRYDMLHFHIAYPLLIHYYIWKFFIRIPIIISEHWSAYHFNFNLPKNTKKLSTVRKIFKQNIPVITVSKALGEDIKTFANVSDFPLCIIPNIIDTKIFYLKNIPQNKIPTFFIVNYWRDIKNPFPMLKGFSKLKIQYRLKIGGYGDLYQDIKTFVRKYKMEDKVVFLEKMTAEEISNTFNHSDIYLYTSLYETFSVICAEAISCGIPLMGPKIDAILEYTDENNAIYIEKNDDDFWFNALNSYITNHNGFNRLNISNEAKKVFSHEKIKKNYLKFINR